MTVWNRLVLAVNGFKVFPRTTLNYKLKNDLSSVFYVAF